MGQAQIGMGKSQKHISFKGSEMSREDAEELRDKIRKAKWARRGISAVAVAASGGLATPFALAGEAMATVAEEGLTSLVERGVQRAATSAADHMHDLDIHFKGELGWESLNKFEQFGHHVEEKLKEMGCNPDFAGKFGHHAGDSAEVTTVKTAFCVSTDIRKQIRRGEKIDTKKLVKTVLKELRDGGLWTAGNTLADYELERLGIAALKNGEVEESASEFLSTIKNGDTILNYDQKNKLLRYTERFVEGIRFANHLRK